MGIGERAMTWDYVSKYVTEEQLMFLKIKYGEEITYENWLDIHSYITLQKEVGGWVVDD
jgi:hypothetical protein